MCVCVALAVVVVVGGGKSLLAAKGITRTMNVTTTTSHSAGVGDDRVAFGIYALADTIIVYFATRPYP